MLHKLEPSLQEIKEGKLYLALGMTEEEYYMIENILGRIPNYTELSLFSVMWSEHCSYKNTKLLLSKFPTKGEKVLQGPGEGAGIVDIGNNLAVVFKIESHNHPSAIDPYQGAATGVGGIIRDVFSMGARPVALLNSLRFGELKAPRVKYLLEEVVAGIAGYGNCIGIPTVGGEVQFDDCYEANPLVNAMCVGIINHKDIKKGQAHGLNNTVMYVGSTTGRDGIHGATFASEELSDESENKRPAVQVGDPFVEKLLLEACLELIHKEALVGIQDMGAAGLISSSSEMASKAGMGIELNLDKVPKREKGMLPYEIMLSESQERMLLVIKEGCEEEVIDLFIKYDLHAVPIGKVISEDLIRIFHKDKKVAEVPASALADKAPIYNKPCKPPLYYDKYQNMDDYIPIVEDYNVTLLKLLCQPTIASKEWIYNQYDYQVGTNTVVTPGSNAAVLRIRGTQKALAITTDCNSRYVYLDPETGGKIAVSEAARNIICSGGVPLAVTDCLNYGSPENPEIIWQMKNSIKGISQACKQLNTPVISGNVSLYNERSGTSIYPTPIIGMVGIIKNINNITTQEFKEEGNLIYMIGKTKAEFGGSEIQKLKNNGKIFGKAPSIDLDEEAKLQDKLLSAIERGLIKSAHDISEGGLAVALAESLICSNKLGAEINIEGDATVQLFSESQSRFIVSVCNSKRYEFEKAINALLIGKVTNTKTFIINNNKKQLINLCVEHMRECWKGAIRCLVKSKV